MSKDTQDLTADVEAIRLLIEMLIHNLCTAPILDEKRLLHCLEFAHRQLESGLGEDHEIVLAFGEQRARLLALLLTHGQDPREGSGYLRLLMRRSHPVN